MTSPSLDATRPTTPVGDRATDKARIGFDVGGTKTLGVLLSADGRVLAQTRIPTSPGPDGIVQTLTTATDTLLRESALAGDDIAGIGIGIPGLVNSQSATIEHAVNLAITEPLPLARLVRSALSFSGDIHVENDVNVAALGVVEELQLRDRVVSLISVGTGLAAGLVTHGKLWRGAVGTAGEIGHVSIDPNGPLCKCGQRGCLEQYASGSALARQWDREPTRQPAAAVFAAAEDGDPDALALRDSFVAALASAVQLLVLAVDPDVVVLSGGVASIGQPLQDATARVLRERAATSEFLASLRMEQRLRTVVSSGTVAAVGAANIRA